MTRNEELLVIDKALDRLVARGLVYVLAFEEVGSHTTFSRKFSLP